MVEIIRIQAIWSNFTGAPGYSNFHFATDVATVTKVTAAGTAVRTFFDSIKALLPTGIAINQQGIAGVYDLNGPKKFEYAYTPPTAVTGTSAAAYAGGTGAVIHWKTGAYNGGRPFIGRTFLVPLAGGYEANGTLTAAAVLTLQGAANGLKGLVDPTYVVWAVNKATKTGRATAPASAVVPDRTATMRSRR